MNRLIINLEALNVNFQIINSWMRNHGASWTLVTKVLCGHRDTLRALQRLGVVSMGDSRLDNLRAIERIVKDFEAWYLRLPHLSVIPDVVALSDVSLNSEIQIIEAINKEAKKQGKIHKIIVMIELGDLREGILPSSLTKFYDHVFDLGNIDVVGIGTNIGCLSGTAPDIDQLTQLILYHELLELKFQRKLSMISAGSSIVLPLMLNGLLPRSINHFRIGEAVFLGTDLISGGVLQGLRDDVIILESEIAEIKEKNLIPTGEPSASSPFEVFTDSEISPGQRGFRAIVTVGQLDTDVAGLRPLNPAYQIAGASSDLTVVNIGDRQDGLTLGDTLKFKLNYSAFLRVMAGKYITKIVSPSIEAFMDEHEDLGAVVPPAIDKNDDSEDFEPR